MGKAQNGPGMGGWEPGRTKIFGWRILDLALSDGKRASGDCYLYRCGNCYIAMMNIDVVLYDE
jgi:hypothetical protein